jgi:hypothetical protein
LRKTLSTASGASLERSRRRKEVPGDEEAARCLSGADQARIAQHPEPLVELDAWLRPYRRLWEDRLDAPIRRRILDLLLERPRSVGELVDRLALSQPGTSKHLLTRKDATAGGSEPLRVLARLLERFRSRAAATWPDSASCRGLAR